MYSRECVPRTNFQAASSSSGLQRSSFKAVRVMFDFAMGKRDCRRKASSDL